MNLMENKKEEKKIKIVTLSDDPRMLSGVAIQTRYFIQALLETGRFEIFSIGGAIRHNDYRISVFEEYGEAWKILPVDGFGDPKLIRGILLSEKPDMFWIMTDPRYWEWLFLMENEIRIHCPIVYYHVWDNLPVPKFNEKWYRSCDAIVTISKLTDKCVEEAAPEIPRWYLPHTVNEKEFELRNEEQQKEIRQKMFSGRLNDNDFVLLFNNRNAGRKHPHTLLIWLKRFLEENPEWKERLKLVMHCAVSDEVGVDLRVFLEDFDLESVVTVSNQKIPSPVLCDLYNACDATISLSDAEGFGMAILESLFCGTPLIAGRTGGVGDQFIDYAHGLFIEPSSSMALGTLQVPYIFSDHYSYESFSGTLMEALEYHANGNWKNKEISEKCRNHAMKNFSMNEYKRRWIEIIDWVHQNLSGKENREKTYCPWELKEVA